jgi:hypothetical protein
MKKGGLRAALFVCRTVVLAHTWTTTQVVLHAASRPDTESTCEPFAKIIVAALHPFAAPESIG